MTHTDLIARLRKRAEDEREIQRNNEAVAEALTGQLEAFNRRDGSHNNFAVRLGLEHRNCAQNDAKLAADWAEAADALTAAQERIEALEAALEDAEQTLMLLGDDGCRLRIRAALDATDNT